MNQKAIMFRSKVYVRPGKGRKAFCNFLRICTIILAIAMIADIASGFHAERFLSMGFSIAVMGSFLRLESNRLRYESCIAEARFGPDELQITYQQNQPRHGMQEKQLHIPYQEIVMTEYSKELSCLKLSFRSKIKHASNRDYHLLYVEQECMPRVIAALKEALGADSTYREM